MAYLTCEYRAPNSTSNPLKKAKYNRQLGRGPWWHGYEHISTSSAVMSSRVDYCRYPPLTRWGFILFTVRSLALHSSDFSATHFELKESLSTCSQIPQTQHSLGISLHCLRKTNTSTDHYNEQLTWFQQTVNLSATKHSGDTLPGWQAKPTFLKA